MINKLVCSATSSADFHVFTQDTFAYQLSDGCFILCVLIEVDYDTFKPIVIFLCT